MRTVNTSAIISKALGKLENFPLYSVSKREVIATVICDRDDPYGWELNAALTKAIYTYWEQAALDKPLPALRSRDELTNIARQVALNLANPQ